MARRNQADKRAHADMAGGAFFHFVSGTIFGSGVVMSGMADSRRATAFFNLNSIREGGPWDYTLGIVMGTAIPAIAVLRAIFVRNLAKPVRADRFAYQTIAKKTVTPGLVAGAALFGLGWSLSGACPGPLLVQGTSLDASNPTVWTISGGFFLGAFLSRKVHRYLGVATAGLLAALTYNYEPNLLLSYLRYTASDAPEPLVRPAIFGGLTMSFAVVLLEAFEGKILGVSGIVGGIFNKKVSSNDVKVRLAFLAGLATAANTTGRLLSHRVIPPTIPSQSLSALTVGTLIGVGTSLGAGCTSGHGLCGLSRFSARSIVATCTFMVVNAAVSTLLS